MGQEVVVMDVIVVHRWSEVAKTVKVTVVVDSFGGNGICKTLLFMVQDCQIKKLDFGVLLILTFCINTEFSLYI